MDISNTKVGGFNFEFLRGDRRDANANDGDFESWIQVWAQLANRVDIDVCVRSLGRDSFLSTNLSIDK